MSWFRTALATSIASSLTVAFIACVGDDPTASPAGGDAATGDASTTSDGATNGDTFVGDANVEDVDNRFDAGPPVWTAEPPPGTKLAAPLGTANVGECSYELNATQSGLPPQYAIYLEKAQGAFPCDEPRGFRVLGSGFSLPKGRLFGSSITGLIAIAFSSKKGASGSSPIEAHLLQVDALSGNDLHVGSMKTKAILGEPVTPALEVENLFVGDQTEDAQGTIRLKGSGSFPGESGTGNFFYAKYVGFLAPQRQFNSAADTCERGN